MNSNYILVMDDDRAVFPRPAQCHPNHRVKQSCYIIMIQTAINSFLELVHVKLSGAKSEILANLKYSKRKQSQQCQRDTHDFHSSDKFSRARWFLLISEYQHLTMKFTIVFITSIASSSIIFVWKNDESYSLEYGLPHVRYRTTKQIKSFK